MFFVSYPNIKIKAFFLFWIWILDLEARIRGIRKVLKICESLNIPKRKS
jgi:hypothetical protein